MNKKTYSKPQVKTRKICAATILAGSDKNIGVDPNEEVDPGAVEARRHYGSNWDD